MWILTRRAGKQMNNQQQWEKARKNRRSRIILESKHRRQTNSAGRDRGAWKQKFRCIASQTRLSEFKWHAKKGQGLGCQPLSPGFVFACISLPFHMKFPSQRNWVWNLKGQKREKTHWEAILSSLSFYTGATFHLQQALKRQVNYPYLL